MMELAVSFESHHSVLLDDQGKRVQVLAPGDTFALWTGSVWQAVTWMSGGYKGEYYQTASGERGRLGVGTRVRLPDASARIEEGACRISWLDEGESENLDDAWPARITSMLDAWMQHL